MTVRPAAEDDRGAEEHLVKSRHSARQTAPRPAIPGAAPGGPPDAQPCRLGRLAHVVLASRRTRRAARANQGTRSTAPSNRATVSGRAGGLAAEEGEEEAVCRVTEPLRCASRTTPVASAAPPWLESATIHSPGSRGGSSAVSARMSVLAVGTGVAVGGTGVRDCD
jgi:hypothetical protein